MKIEINENERDLLNVLLSTAVKNGNSVYQYPFSPTPEQYTALCKLWNKISK